MNYPEEETEGQGDTWTPSLGEATTEDTLLVTAKADSSMQMRTGLCATLRLRSHLPQRGVPTDHS